jgi:hypothetical protein
MLYNIKGEERDTCTQQQTKIALANIIVSLMYLWAINDIVKGNPITRYGNSYLMHLRETINPLVVNITIEALQH